MKKSKNKKEILNNPWSLSQEEVLEKLDISADRGLTKRETKRRLKHYGSNRLSEIKRKSVWTILLDQLKNLIVVLLGAASLLSFLFGKWMEGFAIVAVILINTAIGFFTELSAVRSMEALRRMGRVGTKVRREGEVKEIPAQDLVPGDIVILEGGDTVTADIRLLEASKMQADESSLTGESAPVSKNTEMIDEDTPLAERSNMLFKGTAITRGSGEGVVVATGMKTELGQISSLVEEAEEEITPLEKRLNQLGHRLIWVTLVITVLIVLSGILSGKELFLMVYTAIALAVAAIPEGLPIVATIALARGMYRMAKRNALMNKLSSVETLGATNVIFTDKTGTLTENRMTVTRIVLDAEDIEVSGEGLETEGEFLSEEKEIDPSENDILRRALEVGVLCNNASFSPEKDNRESGIIGEPLEIALLVAGAKAGIKREAMVKELPEEREEAFDPDIKMMATFHRKNGQYRVAVKGAPESVIDKSSSLKTKEGEREMSDKDREEWLKKSRDMAEKGLRILAVATRMTESADADPYHQLTFLGLVGFLDPPRQEVAQAIKECKDAGIRVIMVTGDQEITAESIGVSIGLIDEDHQQIIHGRDLRGEKELSEEEKKHILKASIFARVSPKQKLDLVDIFQKNNFIAGMTGDGVNDAPALKKADIGIAMGKRGTQVAREAADMILKDDAFSSIAAAIKQGRVIFNNIRKFVLYLISCNVSEIISVSLASAVQIPLPILPLQILFLNLVTDVFPALALGAGEGEKDVMKHPPRDPKEPILKREHWLAIIGYGILIMISVIGALLLALFWLKNEKEQAVTISFLTLAFAQLWHVFNMREHGSHFFHNDITRNPFVWGALVLCIGLLLTAVYFPPLATVLKVINPGIRGWGLILVMSMIPFITGQVLKPLKIFRGKQT